MPLEIVRNDITKMQVDAIVNTANPRPIVGGGVDFSKLLFQVITACSCPQMPDHSLSPYLRRCLWVSGRD